MQNLSNRQTHGQDIYNGICVVHAHYEGPPDDINLSDLPYSDSGSRKKTGYIPRPRVGDPPACSSGNKQMDIKQSQNNFRKLPNVTTESNGFSGHAILPTEPCDVSIHKTRIGISNHGHTHGEKQKESDANQGNGNDDKNDKNDKNNELSGDNARMRFDFIHDFMNFSPDIMATHMGSGYVKFADNMFYVITCNHIMVKYARYKGYCYDISGKIVEVDLAIHTRIPEFDIAILIVLTHLVTPLAELIIDNQIEKSYPIENNNLIVTGIYIPNKMNKTESIDILQELIQFLYIPISREIQMVFEPLVSRHIHHIPLFNVPVEELPFVKEIICEHKIDDISKTIAEKAAGLSGSIIRSNDKMIGMIIIYTDTKKMMSIKAIPLFLLDIIFKNVINKRITQLMGIQIDTYPCSFEYKSEHMFGHIVKKDMCGYINGKKIFNIIKGDIITEIDTKQFNENGMIWSDDMNMFVPPNTYTMIKTNMNPNIPIVIKISKQSAGHANQYAYNLMCIPYNAMYRTRISDRVCCWGETVFIELSEEMRLFYKKNGINIIDSAQVFDEYANNNEKIIIVFNYKKLLPRAFFNKKMYIDMPYRKSNGYMFYTLHSVGKKKILNIDDLVNVFKIVKKQNNKTVTLKLLSDTGTIESMRINV